MEIIKYLLGKVVVLAFILLLGAFVLWLGRLLYPDVRISNYASSTGIGSFFSGDWLPAPKQYGGLFGNAQGTDWEPNPEFNGYATQDKKASGGWITYANGNQSNGGSVNEQVFTGNTSSYAEKSLYIRNLSLYEGGNISYAQTIYGEARDTMFKNGTFPIIIIDRTGKTVSVSTAINMGTWAAPGWARFQATIQSRLPPSTDCAMVFYSATQPIKVGIPVRCN